MAPTQEPNNDGHFLKTAPDFAGSARLGRQSGGVVMSVGAEVLGRQEENATRLSPAEYKGNDMVDARAVEEWLAIHPDRGFHSALFGSASSAAVTMFVIDALATIGEMPPRAIFEYHLGQVATACVELVDGRRLAVKIYPVAYEAWDVLVAARSVQRHLADAGLPVPRPFHLARVRSAVVAVDEYVGGSRRACHDAPGRGEMVARLAQVIVACPPPSSLPALAGSRLHRHPQVRPAADDPQDLRDAAALYARLVDASKQEFVLAHVDWRTQNVAWNGDRVSAIYDWDSVAVTSEAAAVGAAAGMYTYDFRDDVPHVASPAEVRGFISEYNALRSIDGATAAAAAAVKMLGYAITENARILGANDRHLTTEILIPSALSWIVASLHTSFGLALVGAVVGELFGATQGVGELIYNAKNQFDAAGVFAGMGLLAAMELVAEALITALEDRSTSGYRGSPRRHGFEGGTAYAF